MVALLSSNLGVVVDAASTKNAQLCQVKDACGIGCGSPQNLNVSRSTKATKATLTALR